MGSKPSNSTTTSNTSTYAPPAWLSSNLQNITNQANSVASTPYQAYSGELVAGLNGQQNTGISAVNSASGIQNGYNSAATGLAGASAASIDPTQFSASQVQQYESPYNTDVVDATLAQINNQNAQQQASLKGNMISSGAFGGDRAGVAAAALGGQQALATNQTIAGLNNQNYQQALEEFNNQQQTNLSAQQNTAARQLAASQQLGTLGSTAQTEALNEANAQVNAGTLQQQTQQAQDTASYNQYLQQMAYPFQTTSWLANLVGGLGGLAGGTSTSNGSSQTDTSVGSSILGGLIGLGSIFSPSKADGGAVGAGGLPHKAYGGGLAGPHFANGGGLAGGYNFASGGGLGGSIPYGTGTKTGLGGGSWVPDGTMQAGHLSIPQQSGMGGGLAGQSQTPQQMGQSIAQTANGLKGLGTGIQSLWNSYNNAPMNITDNSGGLFGGLYANGGLVPPSAPGALSPRPAPGLAGYSSGGLVTRPKFGDGGDVGNIDNTPAAAARYNGLAGNYFANGGLVVGDGGLMQRPHFDDGGSVDDAIAQASTASGIPLPIARAVVMQESSMDPNAPHGGLMQILPSTARDPGYGMQGVDPATLSDPYANARFGLGYMAAKSPNTDWTDPQQVATALQRYNGGGDPDYVQHVLSHIPGGLAGNGTQPLAYDSTTPSQGLAGSPGVQAINNAAPVGGLGGGTASPDGSSNDSWGSGILPKGSLGGFGISDNMRQALLAAGLGMMGGTSKNAFVNIGQGGLAGINAYNTAQQTQAKTGLERAQAEGFKYDNMFKEQRAQAMFQALKDQQRAAQTKAQQIQSGQNQSIQANLTTPTITASQNGSVSPSAANNASAPSTPRPIASQPVAIDPTWDVDWNLAQANHFATAGLPDLAKQYQNKADLILRYKMTRDVNGRMVPLPGANEVTAASAAATAAAEASARAPFDLVEVTPVPGGPTQLVPKSQLLNYQKANPNAAPVNPGAGSPPGSAIDAAASANPAIAKQPGYYAKRQEQIADNENQMIQQFQSRQLARQRLEKLSDILQTYQTGAFAERKADMARAFRSAGFDVKDTDTANPAAFQEFTKNAIANVFNDLKSMGGRTLVSEIEGLSKSNANAELEPAAAGAIIGQGLGLLNYEDQHTRDYFGWKQKNPNAYDPSSFELNWSKDHPVSGYVDAAGKDIAPLGAPLPSKDKLVDGQSYMVKGAGGQMVKARWNAARRGFMPVGTQ